ncbi:D-2-hydroxyacid dehydrogenase family protein [Planococcus halotolerans]|uniref:D-2-hydroxyacid dehydrogenase family protein n=1 Tax=Planococcus halotolerans TaxID=2233542 RepID=UPI0010927A1F|nr:D-2-hydroxyacid dehydrogenase family protein [Planococcus halotolerans]QHJ70130.1 D-2-hydroxyacid dehydrogenase family protein [Planococcus halotolerans]
MIVLILDDWEDFFRDNPIVKELQDQFTVKIYNDKPAEEELLRRLKEADVVIPIRERTKFSKEILNEMPQTKLISQTGSGTAHIDMEEAKKLNITVTTTTGGYKAVVELIFSFILAFTKKLVSLNNQMKKGYWPETNCGSLESKTIGIIGLGKIGLGVAKIAKAFDMRVIAWGPRLTKERALAAGVEFVMLDELLAEAHFITLNVRLVKETTNLITERHLKLMREDAYLINTSRGAVVNEEALMKALEQKWIAGAGLDVFQEEPLPKDHPLRYFPNVLLTPHIGWKADNIFNLFLSESMENIYSFLKKDR